MTNRDLFHATMRRENGENLLHVIQGFDVVLSDWQAQGLPPELALPPFWGLSPAPDLFDQSNTCKFAYVGWEQFYVPAFDEELLEETATRVTRRNSRGNTAQIRTDGGASLPHEIDFAIKGPDDYARLRERLVGQVSGRVESQVLADAASALRRQQDHLVSLWVHGPFGYLRELLGVEQAILLPYTEPNLTQQILDDHLQASMACAESIIADTRPDLSYVWEDCCGSSGPMVSPPAFRRFYLPWYQAWKGFLREHGVPWVVMDTDGDPTPLVGLWIEAGVDCILPWEVNSVDMLAAAEMYPDLVFMGGIYKHMFEPDAPEQVGRFPSDDVQQAIEAELARVVAPMQRRGGYIPSLDHWVYRAVHYPDFAFYCRLLESEYGVANQSTRFAVPPCTNQLGV